MHSSKLVAAESRAVNQSIFDKGLYASGLKRVFDLAVVLAALPFLLPFFAVIALMISRDGHSPFFRQERVGQNGKRFFMWKFRTMVPDAESKLQSYLTENAEAREEWETKQKLTRDPRITGLGRILRKTSVDELPQLFNVVSGDMSLIGPRPMMPCQQALYPGHGYYRLRPGLTGSWQVSERHTSTFAERATYDDAYEQELSFATDMTILAKTVGVVLRGTGV